MPRTYKCSFCGKEFISEKGMLYVKNDGSIYRFCSSKCRRSRLFFKRDARKLKWTEHYEKRHPQGLITKSNSKKL